MEGQLKEQLARVSQLRARVRAAQIEQKKLRNRVRMVREENTGLRIQMNSVTLY